LFLAQTGVLVVASLCYTDLCKINLVTEQTRKTIDELARDAGLTVRNVRAYQTRGLLPPPELQGRTGYYGDHHLARLRMIKDMQAAGFNLGAIKALLDAAPPGSEEEVLRFERALLAPWGSEDPQVFDPDELLAIFKSPDAEVVRRAIELGLISPLDDGRFEVPMPTILRAGRELFSMGIPAERSLDVLEALLQNVRGVAQSFVRLFIDEVWRPFESSGEPPESWPDVREALERLRPLASEALTASFQKVMSDAVEEAFGREFQRRQGSQEEAV
jgi:DNA-binding transcriptional MerR regulator